MPNHRQSPFGSLVTTGQILFRTLLALAVTHGFASGIHAQDTPAQPQGQLDARATALKNQQSLSIEQAKDKMDEAEMPPEVKKVSQEARGGNPEAQYALARRYANGDGVVRSDLKSSKWDALAFHGYEQLAKTNDPTACRRVATCIMFGRGTVQNTSDGIRMLTALSDKGDYESTIDLALIYNTGIAGRIPQDHAKALALLQRASDAGDAVAPFILGVLSCEHDDTDAAHALALKCWRLSADRKYPPALHQMGCAFAEGIGVTKNSYEATKWWKLAAEAGSVDSMVALYNVYLDMTNPINSRLFHEHRYSIIRDSLGWNEARAACESIGGHLACIGNQEQETFVHSMIHDEGIDPTWDLWIGLYHDKASARWRWVNETPLSFTNWSGGDPYILKDGPCAGYVRGRSGLNWASQQRSHALWYICEWDAPPSTQPSIVHDNSKALEWLTLAATKFNADAMCMLGLHYNKGDIVARNDTESVKWLQAATDRGSAEAANVLAYKYDAGEGVKASHTHAVALWTTAEARGDEDAKANMAEVRQAQAVEGKKRRDEETDRQAAIFSRKQLAAARLAIAMKYTSIRGSRWSPSGSARTSRIPVMTDGQADYIMQGPTSFGTNPNSSFYKVSH
ncbi:MAG: lectin-like protein [Proteobacteria bacterium]|nr:lectin-like protein [Pseudomonadota bacterium]